jgi:hypothetical protein
LFKPWVAVGKEPRGSWQSVTNDLPWPPHWLERDLQQAFEVSGPEICQYCGGRLGHRHQFVTLADVGGKVNTHCVWYDCYVRDKLAKSRFAFKDVVPKYVEIRSSSDLDKVGLGAFDTYMIAKALGWSPTSAMVTCQLAYEDGEGIEDYIAVKRYLPTELLRSLNTDDSHGNSDAVGLGLFMVKNHIESLGGEIEIESKVDVGTKFILHFI